MSAGMDGKEFVERLRKASSAVYIAMDKVVADDLSAMLKEAAERIEAALPPPPAEGPESGQASDAATQALKAYEQWEADLILDGTAWRNDTPNISQEMWDRFVAIQPLRNAALQSAPAEAPNPASQDEVLDRLVDLEKKATAGPWQTFSDWWANSDEEGSAGTTECIIVQGDVKREIIGWPGFDGVRGEVDENGCRTDRPFEENRANAAFIVALRNAFPQLVERVKRAEGRIHEIADYVERHWKGAGLDLTGDWLPKTVLQRLQETGTAEDQLEDAQDQLSALQSKLQMAVGALRTVEEAIGPEAVRVAASIIADDDPLSDEADAIMRAINAASEALSILTDGSV